MTKKILFKLGTPILALSLVAACGGTTEEDPIENEENSVENEVDPVKNGTETNQVEYNGIEIEPTENETDDDFGKKLDEDTHVEDDIPRNHLEKDEETESSSDDDNKNSDDEARDSSN
ncbi:hypothetical protein [Oceanobacillus senegalensis]|uniref:hypothetical protein n=1 Tax=Oceanobacillus senegalensis TaxID=1936063 RepID=UPI000A307D32|nr:hypothetical protein [Oceanobacillus senegalensis]